MANQVTLYGLNPVLAPDPWKCALLLELLGVEYELCLLDFGADKERGVKGADYLAICPNGKTPTLVDHSNNDYTIWESNAVLSYIAEHYDKDARFSSREANERSRISQWLFFQGCTHAPAQGSLNYFRNCAVQAFGQEAPDFILARFESEFTRVLRLYELRLEQQAATFGWNNAFLALDRLTIADIAAASWLRILPKLQIDTQKEFPHVMSWLGRAWPQEAAEAVQKRLPK